MKCLLFLCLLVRAMRSGNQEHLFWRYKGKGFEILAIAYGRLLVTMKRRGGEGIE